MAPSPQNVASHGFTDKRVGLPLFPEIVELVFWEMDASTFFIAIQTCKQFAEAGSTRKNLLRQIGRIPGGQLSEERKLEDLCYEELRRRCCQHAAKSGCMAWVLADLRRCKLPLGTMVSRSAFTTHLPASPTLSGSRKFHVALGDDNGTINVYSVANNDIKQTLTLNLLRPHRPYRQTKIYALAFSRKGDLIVVHSQGAHVSQRVNETHHIYERILDSAEDVQSFQVFEVTTFYQCTVNPKESAAYRKPPRYSQTLGPLGAEPVSVALACRGNAVLAWRTRNHANYYSYNVELLEKTSTTEESIDPRDEFGTTYHQYSAKKFEIETVADDLTSCDSMHMKFVDGDTAFLISKGALPLYQYVSNSETIDSTLTRTFIRDIITLRHFTSLAITQRVERESFRIGTPFYRKHALDHAERLRARASCLTTYLALGVLNIQPCNVKNDQYLYVLLQQEPDEHYICQRHAHVDRITLRDVWTPVALLAGWHPSRSSVGSLLETTPQGNRIASADWDRVLVWTIHPDELCEMNLKVYFPARDFNTDKELGRIRPIMLPPQGVVQSMKWINQDVLFALTDKGLVSWDVGPHASGRRLIDAQAIRDSKSTPAVQNKRSSCRWERPDLKRLQRRR